jgi:PAS domain S-box-containing protein
MRKGQIRYDILVVEDNPGDYVLVEDFLEETGIIKRIRWAKNFKSAAGILNEHENQIDLIFLDLSLPDKSGQELIEDILALSNNLPIIILTGYADADFALKSLSLGASDYLVKDVLNATILNKSIVYNIERNKILVNLKDSEKRYSDLFHFSPLPLWVFDQDSLKFLDVNDAAVFHYGYSFEEFMNIDITEIMVENSINDFKSVLDSLQEVHQNLFLGLQNHKKKDGEVIQVELRANSYVYNGRPAEIISISDVTEKNQQMEAIEKQNGILKDIAWTQSHVVRDPLLD